MKYSDANQPIQCFQHQSTWLTGTKTGSKPIGILWHDTAAGNPYIHRYVQPDDNAPNKNEMLKLLGKNQYGNDWNHIYRHAGLNCWIGKLADGSIATVQAGPWDAYPWGCGNGNLGSCNGTLPKTGYSGRHWIQFEICDDGYKSETYFNEAFEEGCQITAYLCKKYGIDPSGRVDYAGVSVPTILCHQDSYRLQLGCDHSDVYKWFGKFGKTMNDVRKRVIEILKESTPAPTPVPVATGDVVMFNGTTHYTSATGTKGFECKPGPAIVSKVYKPESSKHPYHCIALPIKMEGKQSNVYGWVNKADIQRLELPTVTTAVQPTNGPDTSVAGIYEVTGDVNIREGAGTNHKSYGMIKQGTLVYCDGRYSLVGTKKWYYLKACVNGTMIIGFSSSTYFKKIM